MIESVSLKVHFSKMRLSRAIRTGTVLAPLTFFLLSTPLQAKSAAAAAWQTEAQGKPSNADASLPVYDVSVIRPAAAPETGESHDWTRLNTLEVRNMGLINLLSSVFDVPKDMIFGLPEWAQHARLDIDAKTLDPDMVRLRELSVAQRQAMVQALFEDRLRLKWHHETRVLPSYDLLMTNGGPKLKPTVAKGHNNGISVNDTRFRLTNVPVSDLAVVLSDKLGRPVVDKTGLAGRYDISLVWSPDLPAPSGDPDAPPPLFTAVREQLGLKLEGGKDPVQVFVIDRLTPPAAN